MAFEAFFENESTVYIKFSGTVSADEILTSQRKMTDDGNHTKLRHIIIDATDIENNLSTDQDVEDMSALSIAQSQKIPFIKNAIIMNDDESSQALTAYYQFLAESTGWDIQLFTRVSDARQWLQSFEI